MKTKLFLLLLLTTAIAFAQAPAIQWDKTYGGTGNDYPYQIIHTSDLGYLVCGYTQSNDGDVTNFKGGIDIWLVKTDASGVIEWQRTLGGTGTDMPGRIYESDSGYIVAGVAGVANGDISVSLDGMGDIWLVKLDFSGNIQWQRAYGGSGEDVANDVIPTAEGGIAILGYSSSLNGDLTQNNGSRDVWVINLDALGNIIWQESFGGNQADFGIKLLQTSDGGFIIAGETRSGDGDVTGFHGDRDAWVIKLSNDGNLQWQKAYGGMMLDQFSNILPTSEGGYIAAGTTSSTDGDLAGIGTSNNNGWIAKLTATGDIEWQNIYGGSDFDVISSMIKINGGYIVAGVTFSTTIPSYHGNSDTWIFKINEQGTLQWQKAYGNQSGNGASSVALSSDGGLVAASLAVIDGGDVSTSQGALDYWVIKLQPEIMSVHEFNNDCKIHPNPTTNILNIQTQNAIQKITITDITGKIILKQDTSSKQINVEALPAGMYIVQILSEGKTTQQKFIKE